MSGRLAADRVGTGEVTRRIAALLRCRWLSNAIAKLQANQIGARGAAPRNSGDRLSASAFVRLLAERSRGCASLRETHPRKTLLTTIVVVPVGAVVLTALHAALLETGVRSRRDTDHCVQASRATPSRRHEPFGRPSSRVLRSGNPRRRFDVRSKGGESVRIVFPGHVGLLV